jgi:histidinol phosphatase-like enzyme
MTDSPHTPHIAPLEGTSGPRRALFIKRWGTLLCARPEGSLEFSPELVAPRALEALFRASQAGWWIYLLGNEDEVAHGSVPQDAWERFEADLLAYLGSQGIRVVRSYACTDDPVAGAQDHCKESVYRLPNTGAMYHAHQAEGIELRSSWVFGDESLELAAGWRAGCLTAGVHPDASEIPGTLETDTAYIAHDLCAALELLIRTVRAA